jgi:dUTP pyrophosphatase
MKFILKSPTAIVPTKGSANAAGYDLYSNETITLQFDEATKVKTGIALELSDNSLYGKIESRSGNALLGFITVAGVIDYDYCGEICVILYNITCGTIEIKQGQRIAQLIILKHYDDEVEIIENQQYTRNTQRGENGFGST